MKAEEFPALLRDLTIPGTTVGPVVSKAGEPAGPGSGLQHGFLVTGQHGGRMAWQVALQVDRAEAKTGTPPAFPAAVPADVYQLMSADVEASIAAWIGQSPAAASVREIERYSLNPNRCIRYGLKVTLHNGERVFIQQVWALGPDEDPGSGNKYQARETV